MTKITKEQAAKILGAKNVRTVERLVSAGRLRAEYEPGKTRRVPMFDKTEVMRLAEDQRQPEARAVPTDSQALIPSPSQIATIADSSDKGSARQVSQFVAFVAETIERARREAPIASDLADKIMLTLADASVLSSLSVYHLREAIREGKLKGRIIGRGFKVKRGDLDAYVRKL